MVEGTEGSLTARMTAAWRAEESEKLEGRKLFTDPYAGHFAGEEGRRFAALMRELIPGHRQMILLRTRYIDDFLRRARAEGVVQESCGRGSSIPPSPWGMGPWAPSPKTTGWWRPGFETQIRRSK